MPSPACCICAGYIWPDSLVIDEKTEKPLSSYQEYPCCSRLICRTCLEQRPQFSNYCPYCQHTGSATEKSASSASSSVYTALTQSALLNISTPPQTPPRLAKSRPREFSEKEPEAAPDVLHFVDPNNDTINTLSIRYGVPVTVLRQTNGIYSDRLLAGRKTILISGEYYKGGVSLSPRPVDGEEEDQRKSKIRKWMMASKVVEYVLSTNLRSCSLLIST
jgi:LysM repeat protein